MPKKLTQEEFIRRAKLTHGDRYDYSETIYYGYEEKLKIICRLHGIFLARADRHLKGTNCKRCGDIITGNAQRLIQEQFIEKCIKKYDDLYDYSKVNYTGSGNKVIVICKIHDDFLITPNNHLAKDVRKGGCQQCFLIHNKSNTEQFIEKAKLIHGNKYIYDLVEYVNAKSKVKIICRIHGIFEQEAYSHSTGCGCPKCSFSRPYEVKEFFKIIKEIHNNYYDYSKSIYIKNSIKMIITCPIHGEFEQTPKSHLRGHGCRQCNHCGWSVSEWAEKSKSSKDFDSFRIYLIRCWNEEEEFFKIGKTYTTVENRFRSKSSMPYFYEILKTQINEDPILISNLEREIHLLYRNFKYKPRKKFEGYTECFSEILNLKEIFNNGQIIISES